VTNELQNSLLEMALNITKLRWDICHQWSALLNVVPRHS